LFSIFCVYPPYDLSLKLADIFQTPPEFWALLQLQYDESEKSRGTNCPFYQLMTIMDDAMNSFEDAFQWINNRKRIIKMATC